MMYHVVAFNGKKTNGSYRYVDSNRGSGRNVPTFAKAKEMRTICRGARSPYIIVDEDGNTVVDGDGNELEVGAVPVEHVEITVSAGLSPAKRTCAFVKNEPYATTMCAVGSWVRHDQEAALLRRVATLFREYPKCSVSGDTLKPELKTIKAVDKLTAEVGLFVCCYKCN